MSEQSRWYDFDSRVSGVIVSLNALPVSAQQQLADFTLRLCEQVLQDQTRKRGFKSLGVEKIVKLNKSGLKRRGYDANKFVYRAMNCLIMLPVESQTKIINDLDESTKLVADYVLFCDTHHLTPSLTVIANLISLVEHLSISKARQYLSSVQIKPTVDTKTMAVMDQRLGR